MTPDPIDHLDRYLAEDGSFERAAVIPGIFLAWCVNLGFASESLLHDAGQQATRLRMRDVGFAEFFVAATHGELHREHLTEQGRAFADAYYEDYVAQAAGMELDTKWASYERLAPWLTERALQGRSSRKPARLLKGRLLKARASGSKWWRFWRKG